MSVRAEDLEDMPLEAARAVAGVLDSQLLDLSNEGITLTRDEAILALGLVNAVIESLEMAALRPH